MEIETTSDISISKEDVLNVMWNEREYRVHVCMKEDTVMDLKRKLFKQTKIMPANQTFFCSKQKVPPGKRNKMERKLLIDQTIISNVHLNIEHPLVLTGTVQVATYMDDEKKYFVKTGRVAVRGEVNCANTKVNKQKVKRKVKRIKEECEIEKRAKRRESKKVLVLDGDFFIYDNEPNVTPKFKEDLHNFLAALYHDYDLMIWTASSLDWIKSKMLHLGIPNDNYEVVALLDLTGMVTVASPHSKFECKPLDVIWGHFAQCNKEQTIMLDVKEASFIMNPKNGLLTDPLNRMCADERQHLCDYLIHVAADEKLSSYDFKKWRSVSLSWRGWKFYAQKKYILPPFICIEEELDEESARCKMDNDIEYIISRSHIESLPYIEYLRHSRDKHLPMIYHLSMDKNERYYSVSEQHTTFGNWMTNNQPVNKKGALDYNKFLVPFSSLVNSTLSAIIETKFKDFKLTPENVFVVERNGKEKLLVGRAILEEPDGVFKCLEGLAKIVEQWFKHYSSEIPLALKDLLVLLRTWKLDKFEGSKSCALRMMGRHHLFNQANSKPLFDFIVKFNSDIFNLSLFEILGKTLLESFHDLGHVDVKEETQWYLSERADGVIFNFAKIPPRNEIPELVRDLRNLASHIFENLDKKALSAENSTADVWNRCYTSVEDMLPGTFSAIHLCCLKLGLAYLYMTD